MAQVSTRYYISETDVAQLIGLGNFPAQFSTLFTRDYAALKRDVGSTEDRLKDAETRLNGIDDEIAIIIVRLDDHDSYLAGLDSRLDAAEATIVNHESRLDSAEATILDHELRIDAAETNITTLQDGLTDHIADRTTHGATGNIVGTDDYCTAVIGGTVLLASAVANAVPVSVSIASTPNAAGVAYLQADAATWVAMLNEIKTDFNTFVTEANAAITQLNALLAAERAAKQLAP